MSGVHVLASLLESQEEQELGLEREAALCASNGLVFVSIPIPDLGTPADFVQSTSVLGLTRVAAGGRFDMGAFCVRETASDAIEFDAASC